MPQRNIEGQYPYAYQGQEKDAETGMEAFELRLWDARIGRWLTTDPYGQYASPYLGMGNNPISMIDPDGGFTCPNPPCNQGESTTFNFLSGEYELDLSDGLTIDAIDLGTVKNKPSSFSIAYNNFLKHGPFGPSDFSISRLSTHGSGYQIYGSGTENSGRKTGTNGEVYGTLDANDFSSLSTVKLRSSVFVGTDNLFQKIGKVVRSGQNGFKTTKKALGLGEEINNVIIQPSITPVNSEKIIRRSMYYYTHAQDLYLKKNDSFPRYIEFQGPESTVNSSIDSLLKNIEYQRNLHSNYWN